MDVKANLTKVCAGGFGVTLLFLAPLAVPELATPLCPCLSGTVGLMTCSKLCHLGQLLLQRQGNSMCLQTLRLC